VVLADRLKEEAAAKMKLAAINGKLRTQLRAKDTALRSVAARLLSLDIKDVTIMGPEPSQLNLEELFIDNLEVQ